MGTFNRMVLAIPLLWRAMKNGAFSETDFTEDLKKFDVPTLVLHGENDEIVPVKDSARKSARLIKGAKEIYYPGAPHGLTATHQEKVNPDLLTFLKESQKVPTAA